MTENNLLDLLRDAVKAHGSQAVVAKMLGYSSGAVSLVLSGRYPGRLDSVLTRVEEVFGTRTVDCPVLGEITVGRCAKERRTPFSTANPIRVRLGRACPGCPNNTDYIPL